jgi:hypothetical protein
MRDMPAALSAPGGVLLDHAIAVFVKSNTPSGRSLNIIPQ